MEGQHVAENNRIYAFPRLSKTDLIFFRIGGNGLGNLLFTWARCLSVARRNHWNMLWPTWPSFKPKNWRVNPYDARTYASLFEPTAEYVRGWRKLSSVVRGRFVSEGQPIPDMDRTIVVQFRGMEDKFAPFMTDLPLIRKELLTITREQHLKGYRSQNNAPIGIHIRCGDFLFTEGYQDMVGQDNTRLPLAWYTSALTAVRKEAGYDVEAHVFSDGTDSELAPILSIPGVKRISYGSAIADLLALSRSQLLIASGSTYSMWASYLEQVPAIWHPHKLLQNVVYTKPGCEVEWEEGSPLPNWVSDVLKPLPAAV